MSAKNFGSQFFLLLTLLSSLTSISSMSIAAEVTVAQPFIEMRTGPGRGYPIFYIVEASETATILKRRTDWFKIETKSKQPKTGWVHLSQMSETLTDDGTKAVFAYSTREDAVNRKWEWSIGGGELDGAATISTAASLHITKNIALQLEAAQVLGEFSDGWMATGSISHSPFPHWRISPYFQIGSGLLRTKPFSTIVQADDQTDRTVSVGGGLNIYVSRRFISFVDYRYHTVLTSGNNNKEISEWKIGIRTFF
ncbi:MAG: hypothetical protein ACI9UN_004108 [Granulosicoccus sp.]